MKVAIYSRKSKFTGKGDSINNQIQMCKDYISNNFQGEKIDFSIYEDEGFTGANTNRPEFKKLMKDIPHKKFDALICYKLDRISRNVSDFSNTLSYIQQYNTNFISIKEQFDTTTPMGRAMIYIASVFAQLERETIAERVKDNMLELAKNGRWSGGKLPLGYDSERYKYYDDEGIERSAVRLIPNEEELKLVKLIYSTYLKEGSLHKTEVYFTMNNIKSTRGILLEKTSLKIILENPIYAISTPELQEYLIKDDWNVYGDADGVHSYMSYNKTKSVIRNGKSSKAFQPKENWIAALSSCIGVIDADTWIKVQDQFKANKNLFPRLGKTNVAVLTGKVKCANCGSNMQVVHGRVSKKTGKKLYYYTCSLKRRSHGKLCNCKNVKAEDIETSVIKTLETYAKNKKEFIDNLKKQLAQTYNIKELNLKKESLNKKLSTNTKLLNGLISKLALAPEIEDILLDRIKETKKEIESLKSSIEEIDKSKQSDKTTKLNIELIDNMLDKCLNLSEKPLPVQKEIISVFTDKILYYPESQNVEIEIIGSTEASKKKLILKN